MLADARLGGAKDVAPTAPLRDVIAALGTADAPYVLAPDPLDEDLAAAAAPPRGYFDDAARFWRELQGAKHRPVRRKS